MYPAELEEIKAQFKDFLGKVIFNQAYLFEVLHCFFLKKKGVSLRMYIHYRKLNKVTIKNKYPLSLGLMLYLINSKE